MWNGNFKTGQWAASHPILNQILLSFYGYLLQIPECHLIVSCVVLKLMRCGYMTVHWSPCDKLCEPFICEFCNKVCFSFTFLLHVLQLTQLNCRDAARLINTQLNTVAGVQRCNCLSDDRGLLQFWNEKCCFDNCLWNNQTDLSN